MESGIRPDPSTPPFPVLFLNSRPLPPAVRLWWFIAAPIISTIPIHLLRCTTITPAATTDLLLPSRPTAAATRVLAKGRVCVKWKFAPPDPQTRRLFVVK